MEDKVLALAALALTACNGPPCDAVMTHAVRLVSSDPVSPAAIGACADFSRAQRECIAAAATDAAALDCMALDIPRVRDNVEINEGERRLVELAGRVQLYGAMHGHLPSASAALTPAERCCLGPDRHCESRAADWTGTWADLGFRIHGRFQFRFAYQTAGDHAVLHSEADLDCDLVDTTSYTLPIDTTPDGRIRIGELASVPEGAAANP